ncbi:CRISPR-associated endonuclease Cas2 [Desulfohalobiaceae bacterium Ax17]|uniref:CRISPR-associated endonuclease Cas2 n=1 Tax=Desulfovulcanus ferrireducens TaxID=2831190 RepID=UPI00207BA511|nr:CRISPR-associated endonuclease Cas2 [Desulfovulcanus ferrireducens]MBT8763529.1 CRISPR-associated endonuclease Cas2 [Desulfovulcanus ferrireducens]
MWILVIYDICDEKRLNKVARLMESYGQRVQRSVFECELDKNALRRLQQQLARIINKDEDAVKFFRLCNRCWEKCVVLGQCARALPLKEIEII